MSKQKTTESIKPQDSTAHDETKSAHLTCWPDWQRFLSLSLIRNISKHIQNKQANSWYTVQMKWRRQHEGFSDSRTSNIFVPQNWFLDGQDGLIWTTFFFTQVSSSRPPLSRSPGLAASSLMSFLPAPNCSDGTLKVPSWEQTDAL